MERVFIKIYSNKQLTKADTTLKGVYIISAALIIQCIKIKKTLDEEV